MSVDGDKKRSEASIGAREYGDDKSEAAMGAERDR